MTKALSRSFLLSILLLSTSFGQDSPALQEAKRRAAELAEAARQRGVEVTDLARESAAEFADSEKAKETSATVLEWIESIGTFYSFPWINWVLVAVGIGLFISHAGQLVIGKFWALVRGKGFSFFEFVNDFLVAAFAALSLPVVLMIPTGQEAFISNPLQVLSAAAVGMILGVILYSHGMKQEMLAGQERIDVDEAETAEQEVV